MGGSRKCPSEVPACGLTRIPSGVFIKRHLRLWHGSGFSGGPHLLWFCPLVSDGREELWGDASRKARSSAGARGGGRGSSRREENLTLPHPRDPLRGCCPRPPPHENPSLWRTRSVLCSSIPGRTQHPGEDGWGGRGAAAEKGDPPPRGRGVGTSAGAVCVSGGPGRPWGSPPPPPLPAFILKGASVEPPAHRPPRPDRRLSPPPLPAGPAPP